ncbi:TPA: type II toxin-antitoxin system antitoxin SocA domain-containing protein [Streptococcus suis]
MAEKIIFCEHCLDDVPFHIEKRDMARILKGTVYSFLGKEAYCEVCQQPVFVEEIDNENRQSLYDAYRKVNGLISIAEITSLLEKYAIGAKPMSELLGWGVNTIPRYLKGDLPKQSYSDTLYRISKDPDYFLTLLKGAKGNLRSHTYEKSLKVTEKLIADGEVPKEQLVANYFLSVNDEITPLALQKLLYYVQGFSFAFTGEFIFQSDCEGWVHGPVYRTIYEKYQEFGWRPIVGENDYDYRKYFTNQEIQLLDSVLQHFSVYNGKVLEIFTHEESPWLLTRGGLKENVPSTTVIDKKLIADFFVEVRDKHNMQTFDDIAAYSIERFSHLHF